VPQRDPGRRPTRHGRPVSRFHHREVIHASNVLDDGVASLVPDVHAKGEVGLGLHGQVPTRLVLARCYLYAMLLRPEYLSQELDRALPTKDGGILRTIRDACDYMTSMGKKRELQVLLEPEHPAHDGTARNR
jgi:hypothetical protein